MNKKKKVALLLSGQLRTFDDPVVMKSWEKFFDQYEVTTFVSCWKDRGRSIGGTPANINAGDGIDEEEVLHFEKISSIFQTNNIQLLNYQDWLKSDEIKGWMEPARGHWLFNATYTATYMRAMVGKMFRGHLEATNEVYDGVFLGRPDLYFTRKPLQDFFDDNQNYIYHQKDVAGNIRRFGPQLGRNRPLVYDILLFSSSTNILKVCDLYYSELFEPSVIKAPHCPNNAPYREPCRVLWAYFLLAGIKQRISPVYAEVYRNMKDVRLLMGRYYPDNQKVWCLDE